jgi:hypothetical protein
LAASFGGDPSVLNRWVGIIAFFLMCAANGALFLNELWPRFIASEPPRQRFLELKDEQERGCQVGIYNAADELVGQSWTRATRSGSIYFVNTTTVLRTMTLPHGVETPALTITGRFTYLEDGMLDDLGFEVRGLPMRIRMEGQYFPPDTFACDWRLGEQHGRVLLEAEDMRVLGDVIRPFQEMPRLVVGQTWRMSVFNPLAKLLPGLDDAALAGEALLARVTGEETISHRGEIIETLVVETQGVKAWVANDGRVLRQELNVPVLGRLVVLDEPFDELAFRRMTGRSK